MLNGESDLNKLLQSLNPVLNTGDFVFCQLNDITVLNTEDIVGMFHEEEGRTVIIRKEIADLLNLPYSFVASWITLTVHSSLDAVGLTAAFSTALATNGISCNVMAALYHDHIFVTKEDTDTAMKILRALSE